MSDELKTRRRAVNKADRVPFGGRRTKLQLSKADLEALSSFHVHWINDKDGQLEAAINAGYTFVEPDMAKSVGSGELHQENSDLNGKVSKVVSRGANPFRAYLMKINLDWYNEDRAAHERDVNQKVDRSLMSVQEGGQTMESGYTPTS